MPTLKANFAGISTEFVDLNEGDYRVKINEIESGNTKENNLPQLIFKLEVISGPQEGKKINDFVTLVQKDSKINEIGYGRVKAYAIACLGEEAGSGEEIDTDQLRGGTCLIVVQKKTRKDKPNDPPRSQVTKVLPIN